jgi:aminoglycoside phosphotransferase (APT) family kinase protein
MSPTSEELRAEKPKKEAAEVERIRGALAAWLSDRLDGAAVEIGDIRSPGESGFSSETMIVDASWSVAGATERATYVVRCRPTGETVFPDYDMPMQRSCMNAARAHGVPSPNAPWYESDAGVLGQPFLVMEAVDGRVPPDSPPYTIHGFLLEADADQKREAYFSTIEAMARLHAIDPDENDLGFLDRGRYGAPGIEQEIGYYTHYLDWVLQGRSHALLQTALERLMASVPEPSSRVFSWGDARFGNTMFAEDGFSPVSLLDWEMASFAPREQDLGWFLFFPVFFSDAVELPRLPDVPSDEECIAHYEQCAGVELQDLTWWIHWASLRHGAIITRLADIREKAGEHMDGFTFEDNFATRILARYLDLA